MAIFLQLWSAAQVFPESKHKQHEKLHQLYQNIPNSNIYSGIYSFLLFSYYLIQVTSQVYEKLSSFEPNSYPRKSLNRYRPDGDQDKTQSLRREKNHTTLSSLS